MRRYPGDFGHPDMQAIGKKPLVDVSLAPNNAAFLGFLMMSFKAGIDRE